MRGPQVRSLAGQWRLCRRNGCDYRPEGVFSLGGGCWCGQSLGLCANEEALIMIMSPLLSQMPLSLSPWPPSFKLQILIQIRSLAQSTSCKNITTVGWNARWVLVSWDGQLGLKDFGSKIWRFKMTETETWSDWITSIFTLRCLSNFNMKCFIRKMHHVCLTTILRTMDFQPYPICLLFMLWIIMWQWPMCHCRMKLLCLGSQCIWYSTFQVSALPLDKLQSSQTFPKENYFRNI